MSQFRAAIEASLDHAEMMNNLCEANFEIKVDKLTSVISYLILICTLCTCIHRIACSYHMCKENQKFYMR